MKEDNVTYFVGFGVEPIAKKNNKNLQATKILPKILIEYKPTIQYCMDTLALDLLIVYQKKKIVRLHKFLFS